MFVNLGFVYSKSQTWPECFREPFVAKKAEVEESPCNEFQACGCLGFQPWNLGTLVENTRRKNCRKNR